MTERRRGRGAGHDRAPAGGAARRPLHDRHLHLERGHTKSGAPAFGTPEYIRATKMTGQLARFYGLPLRASDACAANAPDAQAPIDEAIRDELADFVARRKREGGASTDY